jgi:hypothetical protein
MLKLIACASSLVLLAGCASTQTVLSQAPKEVIHSPKSQTAVAFCLANKNNVPALDHPDGSKIVQIKSNVGAVGMTFSVYPEDTGSRIEIRKPVSVSIAKHRQCY